MAADGKLKIVTIDGPAGSGKSTIGQRLAMHLNWDFLDSGALYRCCAYIAEQKSLTDFEQNSILEHFNGMKFHSIPSSEGQDTTIFLNGEDVSSKIRTPSCAQLASKLAVIPELRKRLISIQRDFYTGQGLVADGRDMGSVIFPEAMLKVYLTASLQARAQRKHKQFNEQGVNANYQRIYNDIKDRDIRDSTRKLAPLRTPESAMIVDTSELSAQEVLNCIVSEVNKHICLIRGQTR